MNLLASLPLAFVMIAGPQILTAIFLTTSEKWQQNITAYLAEAGPCPVPDPGRIRIVTLG